MIRLLALLAALAAPAAAQTDRLLVHSATDTASIVSVIERFEALNPGTDIVYREYNTSELHAAVLVAPPGEMDVVISSAMDLQVDLVNRGLALPFRPRDAVDLPDWAVWRDELYGFTFEPVVMAYNRAAFRGRDLPRTRSDLAGQMRDDPAFFNDRVGTYDIGLSGVGYLFAAQDARRGYQFSRLVESLGRARAKTHCCTYLIMNGVADGSLVFGYNVIGSYAIDAATRDPRIGLYILDDYALVMSRTALIPRTAPNPALAQRFVSFLLSREGQSLIGQDGGLIPLTARDDAVAPARVAALTRGKPLFPIRLGPGLLTYLDRVKRARFLDDWAASFAAPAATE
ncbi:MAG: ABC transporter substrate-binding protein [Paracoccaceae bacterium]|nr:MAG: ABC transporter substrate-binding protein [Paracoccaceae bacterium]